MSLKHKTPTIQDVARHAQVSAATVSRVLSSPERVSEAARERVFEAVRETGYSINQAARSLRMRTARTILIAVPNIGNPFYSTVLDSVIRTASARGYSVLVASRLDKEPNRWLNEYLRSNRADGLLVFDGSLDTSALHEIMPVNGRLPLIAAYDEWPDERVNSVLTDNRAAAHRAVQHLLDYGHRRIGHIAGPSRNAAPNERVVGFREAVLDAGLTVEPDWIIQGDYSMATGIAAAEQFAAMKKRPTAVFSGNDEMAIGFISRLRQLGIECPRDVSVMGFDDINISQHYWPPLTTMRQPREEIGQIATDAVIDIIEGTPSESGPLHVTLTAPLVIRESTARISG